MYTKLVDGTRNFHGNYECSNNAVGECNASSMSARKLEQAFCEYIKEIADFETDTVRQHQEEAQKKQERQALITAHEEKLHQLEIKGREALDFYVSNVFTVEEYRDVRQRLDGDKQAIQTELEKLYIEAEEVTERRLEIAKSFYKNWEQLSNSEKRQFLMQFVDKIVVANENIGVKKGRIQKKVKIFDIVFRDW